MKRQHFLLIALCIGFFMFGAAQSAIVPVGGDAQSSAGSVSYTVGQIAVQTVANSNGSMPRVYNSPTKSRRWAWTITRKSCSTP